MAALWKNTGYVPPDQQGALVSLLTAVVLEADRAPSKLTASTARQAAPGDGALYRVPLGSIPQGLTGEPDVPKWLTFKVNFSHEEGVVEETRGHKL